MIIIDFRHTDTKEGRVKYELEIRGHADYNPGNDIVCAACSMLAETYFSAVLKHVQHIRQVQRHPGDYKVMFVTEADDKTAETIYDTIYEGFRLLASNYFEHVLLK